MNIKEAKEQIKKAVVSYLTKDDLGEYIIPVEKQRPLFLMGPPGVGKTAIMEQIAAEMKIGLVAYSMTHHTRQSILGLPLIEQKKYGGQSYNVSEYTMSEIIATLYELMEKTGVKEGILFVDEINCVSETLFPVMLQFLQYKVFGKYHVPKGWIIVAAGNPPEYNSSVRQFDIAIWDRLKRIDVEPDVEVWKKYAYDKDIHPAVISYLDIEKQNFYRVESTVDGKQFVTARGWEDLSLMLRMYEAHKFKVDEKLICQYIQNSVISKSFTVYYELFNKYKIDYQISSILAGNVSQEVKKRAKEAPLDERLSLIGLLLDTTGEYARDVVEQDHTLRKVMDVVRQYKMEMEKEIKRMPYVVLETFIKKEMNYIETSKKAGCINSKEIEIVRKAVTCLESYSIKIRNIEDKEIAYGEIKKQFNGQVNELKKLAKETTACVFDNMFNFIEDVFSDGQEMLIIVTELTRNPYTAEYISKYGCEKYYKHNKSLLFYERQMEIDRIIEELQV